MAVNIAVKRGIRCLKIAGGESANLVYPIGYDGRSVRSPALKSGLGKAGFIHFHPFFQSSRRVIKRYFTGAPHGDGFHIFAPKQRQFLSVRPGGQSRAICRQREPVFSSRADGDDLKIITQLSLSSFSAEIAPFLNICCVNHLILSLSITIVDNFSAKPSG